MPTNCEKRFFEKTSVFIRKNNDFEGSGGPSWELKSNKNRSKNEVNMGRHLGIDFSSILVDFGSQVGRQNRAKIDQKWHRKNVGKKKGCKIAKKSQKVRATPCGTTGPRPWGGPPLYGGINACPPMASPGRCARPLKSSKVL